MSTRRRPLPLMVPRVAIVATVVVVAALLGGAPVVAAAVGAPTAPRSSAVTGAAGSLVTIVHGLRGHLVDVYLDGRLLLPAFQPDRLTDPTPVPAGHHVVDLRDPGTAADSPPHAEAAFDVPVGKNLAIVAHFATDGSWTMTAYQNDLTPTPAGRSRVVFRNDAGIDAVSVEVDGTAVAPGLASAAESTQEVTAAPHTVSVLGTDSTTLLPANALPVVAGASTFLYLVGTGTDVTWLTQKLSTSAAAPTGVATGNSGLAASGTGSSSVPIGLIAGAALLGLAGVWVGAGRGRAAAGRPR